MDLKAKKESLLQQHQDLTKQINRNIDLRSRVLGALELIEQIEEEKKKKMEIIDIGRHSPLDYLDWNSRSFSGR